MALQRNRVGTGALLCSFNFSLKGHYTRYWGVRELGAQAVESLNTAWVVHKLAHSHTHTHTHTHTHLKKAWTSVHEIEEVEEELIASTTEEYYQKHINKVRS